MGGDRSVRIGDSIALLVIGAIRRFGITGETHERSDRRS
jgi:hypothetical protein